MQRRANNTVVRRPKNQNPNGDPEDELGEWETQRNGNGIDDDEIGFRERQRCPTLIMTNPDHVDGGVGAW